MHLIKATRTSCPYISSMKFGHRKLGPTYLPIGHLETSFLTKGPCTGVCETTVTRIHPGPVVLKTFELIHRSQLLHNNIWDLSLHLSTPTSGSTERELQKRRVTSYVIRKGPVPETCRKFRILGHVPGSLSCNVQCPLVQPYRQKYTVGSLVGFRSPFFT